MGLEVIAAGRLVIESGFENGCLGCVIPWVVLSEWMVIKIIFEKNLI